MTTRRRCALLIGCGTYDNPRYQQLAAPVPDIEEFAALLRDDEVGGYDEVVMIGQPDRPATYTNVTQAIDAFFRDRRPDDLLLLYIACHGIRTAKGELLFIVKDSQPNGLMASAVEAAWVGRCLDASRSNRILVLLDCCYGGSYRARGRDLSDARMLNVNDSGRVVISASQAAQRAWERTEVDGTLPRSVFMNAIIAGLSTGDADLDRDGRISVLDLYEYAHRSMAAVQDLQIPVLQGVLAGTLSVAWRRGERRPEADTEPPEPPTKLPVIPQQPRPASRVRIVPVFAPKDRGVSRRMIVQRWLYRPGEQVEMGRVLLEFEKNGSPQDLRAPATGVLRAISAAEDEAVEPGAVLGVIAIGGSTSAHRPYAELVARDRTLRTHVVSLSSGDGDSAQATALFVGRGTMVCAGDPLLELSTGGRSWEVLSTVDGVVRAVTVELGEVVGPSDIVAIIEIA